MCECIEKRLKEETIEIAEKYTQDKENLIPILNEIQEKYGYIPKTSQLRFQII